MDFVVTATYVDSDRAVQFRGPELEVKPIARAFEASEEFRDVTLIQETASPVAF